MDFYKWVDNRGECDGCYGLTEIILSADDIEKLKSGKILNRGINCDEYAIAIRYKADHVQEIVKDYDGNDVVW